MVARIDIAGPADSDRVRVLVTAFRDHLQAPFPTDSELGERLPALLADPSIEVACAQLRTEAVGYTLTRFLPSLWTPGLEALLEDLFVLPAARGHTIGRQLLRTAMKRARGRGATQFALFTNEHNVMAQALYRSEGLEPECARIWPNGREIRWVIDWEAIGCQKV